MIVHEYLVSGPCGPSLHYNMSQETALATARADCELPGRWESWRLDATHGDRWWETHLEDLPGLVALCRKRLGRSTFTICGADDFLKMPA